MSGSVCAGSSNARLAAAGLTATTILLLIAGLFTLVGKGGEITAHG